MQNKGGSPESKSWPRTCKNDTWKPLRRPVQEMWFNPFSTCVTSQLWHSWQRVLTCLLEGCHRMFCSNSDISCMPRRSHVLENELFLVGLTCLWAFSWKWSHQQHTFFDRERVKLHTHTHTHTHTHMHAWMHTRAHTHTQRYIFKGGGGVKKSADCKIVLQKCPIHKMCAHRD